VSRSRKNALLTPEQVLERYHEGPKTGVFTDGSCEGNPGPGGWGFVWVEADRIVDAGSDDAAIDIYSDSQLCVRTINEWVAGWEARGWRRKGGSIANLELVRELHALARAHACVRLRWIRAHDGSRWNEYVDALATTYLR
jgi:ribonuclease HI